MRAKNVVYTGIMKDSPVALLQEYGNGLILAISCHLEKGSLDSKELLIDLLNYLIKNVTQKAASKVDASRTTINKFINLNKKNNLAA